jgi:hypothetical protein
MTMQTIDRNSLDMAILAMDSYHRGGDVFGVNDSRGADKFVSAAKVGNYSIMAEATLPANSGSISFFAQAYTGGPLGTVIAYRGTDTGFDPFSSLDVHNGTFTGAGTPGDAQSRAD